MKRKSWTAIGLVLCILAGGILTTPARAQEAEVEIPCAKFDGKIVFGVVQEGECLRIAVTYPQAVRSYLGGYENGVKRISADVTIYLDIDANSKTGYEADPSWDPYAQGSEYSIEADEISTSLGKDAEGKWINGPMLVLELKKEDEYEEIEGMPPLKWQMKVEGAFVEPDWLDLPDAKTMGVCVPTAPLGLKPGAKVRVICLVPLCNAAYPFAGHGETAVTLK